MLPLAIRNKNEEQVLGIFVLWESRVFCTYGEFDVHISFYLHMLLSISIQCYCSCFTNIDWFLIMIVIGDKIIYYDITVSLYMFCELKIRFLL